MLSTSIIALNFDQMLVSLDLLRNVLLILHQGSTYQQKTDGGAGEAKQ